jgi:hypothetical protein
VPEGGLRNLEELDMSVESLDCLPLIGGGESGLIRLAWVQRRLAVVKIPRSV